MPTYNDVYDAFSNKGCKLITTKEDYIVISQLKCIPKLYYLASCGHFNYVHFNVFKSRNTGIICPECIRKKYSVIHSGSNSLTVDGQSIRQYYEERCIDFFIDLIKHEYSYEKTFEGCLSDLIIKPINETTDSWLKIQVKTTLKCVNTYSFNNTRKRDYKDCIILCICWDDKRMWIFDGNDMKLSKISIGINKSKYEHLEIKVNNLIERITIYYNTFKLSNFETANTPISYCGKIEYEYTKIRTNCVNIKFTDVSNYLITDFIINNKKVQEKVGTKCKNRNSVLFKISKRNSQLINTKNTTPYNIGDNDFYWLHLPNKKYFYFLPEHTLLKTDGILKKHLRIAISQDGSPTCENLTKYLFEYNNIEYTRFDDILKLSSL